VEQETILVAETEQALRETIAHHLRREGYVVLVAANGVAALEMARQGALDLVLLDPLLPQLRGLEVYRQIQASSQTASLPVIFLLPRHVELLTEEEREVTDYLVKPFSWKELRTLVWSKLRRSKHEQQARWIQWAAFQEEAQIFDVGDLHIDVNRREVTRAGQPIELKARVFDLLVYLVRYPDTVLAYDRLLSHIWGSAVGEHSKTLYVHIHWLREKIEDDPSHPCLIETVYGVGYRFNATSDNPQAKGP
jgi:DNA-binding response OmpR family regulator